MPIAALIISAAAQLLDITLGFTSRNPETTPHFAPVVGKLVEVASRAAGETEEQTARRLADHDAMVARYAAAPPGRAGGLDA
jgi:hypothetical protein